MQPVRAEGKRFWRQIGPKSVERQARAPFLQPGGGGRANRRGGLSNQFGGNDFFSQFTPRPSSRQAHLRLPPAFLMAPRPVSRHLVAMLRLWLLFLIPFASLNAAGQIQGKVVGVHDGDTITVLTPAKEQVKVRLYGIDAPESKLAFGARAKQELSGLVFGKAVVVQVEDKDRYGRIVGPVLADSVDVNLEMVRRGLGWWYRSYAKKDVALARAETEAKNAGLGLWADKAPVPPWEFRKNPSKARVPAGR